MPAVVVVVVEGVELVTFSVHFPNKSSWRNSFIMQIKANCKGWFLDFQPEIKKFTHGVSGPGWSRDHCNHFQRLFFYTLNLQVTVLSIKYKQFFLSYD